LCNVTLPYVLTLAGQDLASAIARQPGLREAVNLHRGKVTHPAVAETFGMPLAVIE
jgi:alanine dehydrogenase